MEPERRLVWLRRVLLIKVILTFFVWALPALLGPLPLLDLFAIARPEDPIFLRLFGAVCTAVGLAYWIAYRDPLGNIGILKFGVADNALATLTVIAVGLTSGVSSWFLWASAVLTALFCIAFVVLMPKEPAQARA